MTKFFKEKLEDILLVGKNSYVYYNLSLLEEEGFKEFYKLPFSLKILLENILRQKREGGYEQDLAAFSEWLKKDNTPREISFQPARILMQDLTGVPAIVDLAMMREAMKLKGQDPSRINPMVPIDLVVDHSVTADYFGNSDAFRKNVKLEFHRNKERYEFLKWGQKAFDNFRVVPPGTGICHQVNLEYLAQVVWTSKDEKGRMVAYPDTVLGTDSHTPMVNGLSVLGWGVGGIEAEAALLAQPLSMLVPEVVGVLLKGKLQEGITATDLVLTITHILRQKGVVGKFVEYFGEGLDHLSLEDRATIANMTPEYGATCGFFPIDAITLSYLNFTGRSEEQVELVEAYAKAQGLWREKNTHPIFSDTVEIDLSTIETVVAGPKRPQDQSKLSQVPTNFKKMLEGEKKDKTEKTFSIESIKNRNRSVQDGDVVIAAITSCTNTSNPFVMVGAALLARNALEKGLTSMPWVKTSLAPGSQVVTEYLKATGLQKDLDALGFNLVGYGCTTCIGNSGVLDKSITQEIQEKDLTVCAVLSGNRNFDGRINPLVKGSYLASPPLVVAYALAGSVLCNLKEEPLGTDRKGNPVYLKDIWPSNQEIQSKIQEFLTPQMFKEKYKVVTNGTEEWREMKIPSGMTYDWEEKSTYIRKPSFLNDPIETIERVHIEKARPLLILGDSITTDHISPAGAIKIDSPAGAYLMEHDVKPEDFNSYGSRRGNHEIMVRGTFANIRLKNMMIPGILGGVTKYFPKNTALSPTIMSVFEVSLFYKKEKIPLIVIAGKEYGSGSSRDWAAKGTTLLGVQAIIAESFERIHRSNLIGMGVLPFEFPAGINAQTLQLEGTELFDIKASSEKLEPKMKATLTIYAKEKKYTIDLLCRIDTKEEVEYLKAGGILPFVMKGL